jgi:hypothetical protein
MRGRPATVQDTSIFDGIVNEVEDHHNFFEKSFWGIHGGQIEQSIRSCCVVLARDAFHHKTFEI